MCAMPMCALPESPALARGGGRSLAGLTGVSYQPGSEPLRGGSFDAEQPGHECGGPRSTCSA